MRVFAGLLLLLAPACQAARPTPSPPVPALAAGVTLVAEVDGMIMVFVPAGEFLMGSGDFDADVEGDEQPQHTVDLNAYWIDRTEVTNAMYQRCTEAGKCTAPMRSPRYTIAAYTHHPVVGVTWLQAQAYCARAGRRLPTEAEWEKAARGTEGHLYPWGNELPDSGRLNFNQQVGGTTEVGQYPASVSPYGALDMAGNVWEWTADWYDSHYYAASPAENPAGPSSGNIRVLRGGAWSVEPRAVRAANRFWAFPGRNDLDGFRCARSS